MKKKTELVPEYPKVIEGFGKPLISAIQDDSACFNGMVKIQRYRITVEIIKEPIEVYQQRLQDLWDKSYNHHHRKPLQEMAKKYSYTLVGNMGSKAIREY